MARRPLLPWLSLITVWIVWGSTYLAIRAAVATVPPLLMAGFRYLIAGALMYAIVGPRHATGAHRPTPRHLRSALVVGALLLLGGNGLVSVGETRLDSGTAALIVATVPIWMILINAAATRTRVTLTMLATLALGTLGVGVLVGGPGSHVDGAAAVLVLVASLSWAAGSIYAHHAPLPDHPLVVTSLEMLAGGALLVVAGAATGEFGRLHLAAISAGSAFGFAWLVVPGSMVGFAAYVHANATLPTDTVATYAYVNPVVAVALGALVDHEPLGANLLLGGAAIVGAVALVVTKAVTRARRPEASQELRRIS